MKLKSWREWADEHGKKHNINIGIRDFGSESEIMTEEQFKETISGQTFSEISKPRITEIEYCNSCGINTEANTCCHMKGHKITKTKIMFMDDILEALKELEKKSMETYSGTMIKWEKLKEKL